MVKHIKRRFMETEGRFILEATKENSFIMWLGSILTMVVYFSMSPVWILSSVIDYYERKELYIHKSNIYNDFVNGVKARLVIDSFYTVIWIWLIYSIC